MQIDLKACDFPISASLADTVRRNACELDTVVEHRSAWLQVRLYDSNGPDGVGKGCLVAARTGRIRRMAVANSVDKDLQRAVEAAFEKLKRSLVSAAAAASPIRHERQSCLGAQVR